jgi:hypothetical protein
MDPELLGHLGQLVCATLWIERRPEVVMSCRPLPIWRGLGRYGHLDSP